jgi:hypothetical protein
MFNVDPEMLFFSLLFSIVGIGYFSYGKKHNFYFLLSGIVLMLFPYFVSQLWSLLIWGLGLIVLPFILNRISPL